MSRPQTSVEEIVIEDLASGEAYWRELACVKHELAVAAFDQLRLATQTNARQREELESERRENARLREAILERGAAA